MYDARTRFVLIWMAFLFLVSWVVALSRLWGYQFWDPVYALDRIHEEKSDPLFYNSSDFDGVIESYYKPPRYVFFLPHVAAAFFWWNLYFFQLIPALRHRYPKLHRCLGRFLMVVAVSQVVTATGLALTTKSSTIKIVSLVLAACTGYCICRAWYYAMARDIPKHKYWVIRLVGYMQTIAMQRFWMMVLLISHHNGSTFLYPSIDGRDQDFINFVVLRIFDDSFVLALITSIPATEWYLAFYQGMMEPAVNTQIQPKEGIVGSTLGEQHPLNGASSAREED